MNNTYYDILITYQTGNSFGSETITDESIGIVTSTEEDAKYNLLQIKNDWIENGSDCMTSIVLKTDDGTRKYSPFWKGYFETLYTARIVKLDPDLEFSTGRGY